MTRDRSTDRSRGRVKTREDSKERTRRRSKSQSQSQSPKRRRNRSSSPRTSRDSARSKHHKTSHDTSRKHKRGRSESRSPSTSSDSSSEEEYRSRSSKHRRKDSRSDKRRRSRSRSHSRDSSRRKSSKSSKKSRKESRHRERSRSPSQDHDADRRKSRKRDQSKDSYRNHSRSRSREHGHDQDFLRHRNRSRSRDAIRSSTRDPTRDLSLKTPNILKPSTKSTSGSGIEIGRFILPLPTFHTARRAMTDTDKSTAKFLIRALLAWASSQASFAAQKDLITTSIVSAIQTEVSSRELPSGVSLDNPFHVLELLAKEAVSSYAHTLQARIARDKAAFVSTKEYPTYVPNPRIAEAARCGSIDLLSLHILPSSTSPLFAQHRKKKSVVFTSPVRTIFSARDPDDSPVRRLLRVLITFETTLQRDLFDASKKAIEEVKTVFFSAIDGDSEEEVAKAQREALEGKLYTPPPLYLSALPNEEMRQVLLSLLSTLQLRLEPKSDAKSRDVNEDKGEEAERGLVRSSFTPNLSLFANDTLQASFEQAKRVSHSQAIAITDALSHFLYARGGELLALDEKNRHAEDRRLSMMPALPAHLMLSEDGSIIPSTSPSASFDTEGDNDDDDGFGPKAIESMSAREVQALKRLGEMRAADAFTSTLRSSGVTNENDRMAWMTDLNPNGTKGDAMDPLAALRRGGFKRSSAMAVESDPKSSQWFASAQDQASQREKSALSAFLSTKAGTTSQTHLSTESLLRSKSLEEGDEIQEILVRSDDGVFIPGFNDQRRLPEVDVKVTIASEHGELPLSSPTYTEESKVFIKGDAPPSLFNFLSLHHAAQEHELALKDEKKREKEQKRIAALKAADANRERMRDYMQTPIEFDAEKVFGGPKSVAMDYSGEYIPNGQSANARSGGDFSSFGADLASRFGSSSTQ